MAIPRRVPSQTAVDPGPPKRSGVSAPARPTTLSERDFLAEASAEVYQRGRRIVLVGGSKLGKTCFAAQMPRTIFICDNQERGIEDLKVKGLARQDIMVTPPVMSWNDIMKVCNQLAFDDHPYQTAVFESITGLEGLCFRHCCHEDYGDNWTKNREGFYNFQNGPKTAAKKYWPELLERFEAIANRGVHVILTGHTTIKPKTQVDDDYDAEIVYCDKETWAITHRWAEAILVMGLSVKVEHGKAVGEPTRIIHCEKTGRYDGGNRYGINIPIQCGGDGQTAYLNFCKAAKIDPLTGFFK